MVINDRIGVEFVNSLLSFFIFSPTVIILSFTRNGKEKKLPNEKKRKCVYIVICICVLFLPFPHLFA